MTIRKTIVVLAKSLKHRNYCVAGKDINSKEWVRPVSDIYGAELSEQQCKCTNTKWQRDGNPPYSTKLLQKVEMNFKEHAPLPNQPENYVVKDDAVWKQQYQIKVNELATYINDPDSLWGDDDRIDYSLIESKFVHISQSLYLIKVDDLKLYKNEHDKRRA